MSPTYEELVRENARLCEENGRLRRRVAQLEGHVGQLQSRIAELTRLLDDALRQMKRQAAPFSKGATKRRPKKPGRKPGARYGATARRPVPPPESINEVHDAPLPEACPNCGGAVTETHVDHQYQIEIPRQSVTRQFNIHIGCCIDCGRRVQGHHALQTSDALGAAAPQLGAEAQATAVFLHTRLGLSYGKVRTVFQEVFGIRVSRGGLVHIARRAAQQCADTIQHIEQTIRTAEQVTPDETGWRVGGHKAWLHTLATPHATRYLIDPTRSADVAARVLDWDWNGVLVHDGWEPYERFSAALHQQCLAHVLRRAHNLLIAATGRAAEFPQRVVQLFQRGLTLRDRAVAGELCEAQLNRAALRLTDDLQRLTARPRGHPGNERLAAHLHRHLWEWFLFLSLPGTDATNYRAEQALRYAVVNRKVWGGNRTGIGADVQARLMSVIETCRQLGYHALDFLSHTLRGIQPQLVPQP
jgi:transposase